MNDQQSAAIFRELINGRMLNRTVPANDGTATENPLYTEVASHYAIYSQQYRMCGYELVTGLDYYYIRERSAEQVHTDLVKRVQALLLIISRHVTKAGALFEKLSHPAGGVSVADIDEMEADAHSQEILKALGIKTGLEAAIRTNLVDRAIMVQMPTGRLILSPAGKAFFTELFASAD